MLISLCIENFAIVARLDLDFNSGMTAFTGETGAGKSIMIDALMLALGGRADASVIRPGADKCEIHAHFTFDKNAEPAHWLEQHDLLLDTHDVWLRRVIYIEGRSKSYINGQPLPLQTVKEFAELLVDIHGQHQHQRLLQHATHRTQLDQYANHDDLLLEVNQLHRACLHAQHDLDAMDTAETNQERITLLHDQIDELRQLNLQENEMQTLHQEHQFLHHAKTYLEQTEHAKTILTGDHDNTGLSQSLHTLMHIINTLPHTHPRIKNAQELINNALIQCDEALNEMEHFSTDIQLDPERLEIVEARISELHQAARKYHRDVHQLLPHLHALEQELQQHEQADSTRQQLALQYKTQRAAYQHAALMLRQSRHQHAIPLAHDIEAIIHQLGIPKGRIEVHITPLETIHAHGQDKVEYYVCTNPGLALDTLSKVASGGELSRISLSIQLITAQKRTATPTLLFDEVDVGIGGTTAALVGQLLRKLGEHLQVFCVTHQPQVASAAHHHCLVEKYIEGDHTFSRIKTLTTPEKIHEIARMLGGLTITEQTRSHARALLLESHADEVAPA